MKWLTGVILFLAAGAAAQTLPENPANMGVSENEEYLFQAIKQYSNFYVDCNDGTGKALVAPTIFAGKITGGVCAYPTAGTSTSSVNASMLGTGSAASPLGVDPASGTLQGNNFNGASQLVKLNGSTQLPAVDGSLLTGLTQAQVAGLTTQINALAASTTTLNTSTTSLAASVGVFRVWQGTMTPAVAALQVWQGTATPAIAALQVWQGTATPALANLQVWQGTMTPAVSSLQIWQGTMTPAVASLQIWQSTITPFITALDVSTKSLQTQLNAFQVFAGTQTITYVIDNFMGNVDGTTKIFTLSQTPTTSASLMVVVDGLLQSGTSDYVYAAPRTITFTTAPAVNSSSFFAQYTVNTSTLPGALFANTSNYIYGYNQVVSTWDFVAGGSSVTLYNGMSLKGASSNLVVGASITTNGGFFGNGAGISGVPSTPSIAGVYARLDGATFTGASGITNQAFTATGANGNIISNSSITGNHFGDGSHLTGLSGTLSGGTLGKSAYWTGATSLGSGGDVVTASSVTVLPASTHTYAPGSGLVLQSGSSMSFGPSAYSSTIAVTGMIVNGWNPVAIASVTTATDIFLYGLTLTGAFTLRGTCSGWKRTADGELRAAFSLNGTNRDNTAGNYGYSGVGDGDNTAVNNNAGAIGAATYLQLTGGADVAISNGRPIALQMLLSYPAGDRPRLCWTIGYTGNTNARNDMSTSCGEFLNGGAKFLDIYATAGTITMSCFWEQLFTFNGPF